MFYTSRSGKLEHNRMSTFRIVTGILCVVLVAIIILRRKATKKKNDEEEF